MWGGRHIQWVGGTYWAGGRWVNGEGGRAGGQACERDVGGVKVVGGAWASWDGMGRHHCDGGVTLNIKGGGGGM